RDHPHRNAGDRLVPLTKDPENPDLPPLTTDSKMTDNFNFRLFEQELQSGILLERQIGLSPFERFGKTTNGNSVFRHVVTGVFLGKGRHDTNALTQDREALKEAAPEKGYKARSLNG